MTTASSLTFLVYTTDPVFFYTLSTIYMRKNMYAARYCKYKFKYEFQTPSSAIKANLYLIKCLRDHLTAIMNWFALQLSGYLNVQCALLSVDVLAIKETLQSKKLPRQVHTWEKCRCYWFFTIPMYDSVGIFGNVIFWSTKSNAGRDKMTWKKRSINSFPRTGLFDH
jgi:hypothetical protein